MKSLPPITRIVTGHMEDGRSVLSEVGGLPTVQEIEAIPGTVFHEVWATSQTPAPVGNDDDPTVGTIVLPPPANGTLIRFVDIPPDTEELLANGAERMGEAFDQIGDKAASTVKANSPHPLMHRTESIDYGVVIEGEITLIMDDGEVLLKPGSVVVQRGTNHAWANRSGVTCRMLFVLVAGQYEPDLEKKLKSRG